MDQRLKDLIQQIGPTDEDARLKAQTRWNACAKPLGSLGLLETALEDIAALTGSADISLRRRVVLVFCADNGVVAQGVTQSAENVTAVVTRNLAQGRTAVCRMAQVVDCDVIPVDMGVRNLEQIQGVIAPRIRNGTDDITQGPAMTYREAEEAILTGAELVRKAKAQGVCLIATGEMGIGNTTTSSAVACALTGEAVETMTGRGSGLSDAGLQRKIRAIRTALEWNRPDPQDPIDVLSKVGGLDLAGICGTFLGGAAFQVPILMDGFISAVAALCACRLCPAAGKAVLATHVSAEPAGYRLLELLHKQPMITAGMRLGEGTGAVAAIPLLDMACAVYREAYTFQEGGIEAYTPQ